MKKQRILAMCLTLLMLIGLTACGNKTENQTDKQETVTTQSDNKETPKEETKQQEVQKDTEINKDSVVIAIGYEPETLDPTQGWGHGNSPIVQSTLVKYKADLTFENDLATDYHLSKDGLTWTVTIREDAKFTDGEKVKASDVAFTLETAKKAQGSVDISYMESAVAKDDKTVVITLSKPTSIFLNTLASVGIVPEHAYGADYGINPIGSGPYKFVEWKPQEQIIFEANEDYYGGALAIKRLP